MAAIEHDVGRSVEDINYKVFQEWLSGSGRKPVSWDTLVAVLQDVEHCSLAKSVREAKCSGAQGATVSWKMGVIKAMFRLA